MSETTELHLTVTAQALAAFCVRIRKQARKPGDALQALTAVQSFLAQVATTSVSAAQAQPLRDCLSQHLDATRAELIQQQADALWAGLRAGSIEPIAACYRQLSRSGFQQAAERGVFRREPAEIQRTVIWLKAWIDQARIRAQGAYPDSYDFAAAGIEPASLLAAEDLYAVLSGC